MADDYNYIDSTGLIVPDTSDILATVQDEYKAVFGSDLIVTPDTPQGALITAETFSRTGVVKNNAALANQINPNISAGIFLDAILAFTGMQRTPATKTIVSAVLLSGVAGTIIPAGTQVKTTGGDVFATQSGVTIGGGGTVTADFASVEYGPIPAAIGTLTMIVTGVLGLETVTNPTAGVLGSTTQSDVGARALRSNTLGFQGVALPVAITSALYNVNGVQSLWFQENVTNGTLTINGISMTSHSIYVCVNGGSDLDVASALLENKSSGASWIGGTTVTIVEPASGQPYDVKFDRPDEIGILIKVTSPNGVEDNIKTAILAYVSGQISGDAGWQVGTDVSPWEIAGAINILYPGTFINKVEVSYSASVSYTTNVLAIAVNEIAVTDSSSITVITA